MTIAVCSNETVYAVPVHITVCVLAQPIYTVYVRVRFFRPHRVLNEEIGNSAHVIVPPRRYFISPGTTVGHPTSFPSLSTRQSALQYEFSSVCTRLSGKYHRPFQYSNYISRAVHFLCALQGILS